VMELLQPGDPVQVGQYRVVRRLGSGGMGRVFLAQSRGGRPVALKMINPGLAADPGFGRRFAREAEAASKVPAFYTAPVIDADPFGDPPWLATAYVAGPSLQDAIVTYGGPLPVVFVRSLGAALAEGLGAIHTAGVVHCDLKPSNVLLASDGPRIIDFGISRAIQATTQTSSAIIGTPAFMSPEQVNGPRAGPPSDVFSLGSVLTYTATGHPPFSADTLAAMIQAVAFGQPFLGRLPRELRPLIERCLDKDPRQRPTTPQIVAELGPVPLWDNWLPEPLARKLPDYRPPVITPTPLHTDARGPITDPPRWRPEDAPKVSTGPASNVPPGPPSGPPVRRPPRRRTKSALAISGAVTISVAVAITIALRLAPHSPSQPSLQGTSSSSQVSTPSNGPTPASQKTSSQVAKRTLTGPWSAQSGPLTLIVTRVERLGNSLQLRMRAINHSSAVIGLPLYKNFVATDNVGTTYQPTFNSDSNWPEDVPSGTSITGTVTLSQAPPVSAKRLKVSFATFVSLAEPGSNGGITVSRVPIPK
jgi:serine/threonine protein kinase